MPQNAEAAAFLARVAELPTGPGVLLDEVLKPSLEDEAELRKLFAQDKKNPRLADKTVGLVDVFDAPKDIRTTRARVVSNDADFDAKYVMPLSADSRRKEGSPAMVDSLDDFKKNWAIFTEGSLSQLFDWSNVVAAGGSVQACLAPVPEYAKASKRSLRKYYHHKAFPTSDVDLFLYGLTPEQAEIKMNQIYEAVRDSIPWDVTCIRTKHTVSIHSQYPYRTVQIVLRLYQSPAEILAGFDVDAPCCAYDGSRVYANPRAIVAMMRQCNTVDVTRRSPSYEVRLTKYSSRDFEVYVPRLDRGNLDPTIFERSIVRVEGLARLLVLERLATPEDRDGYLQSRRRIRGRPEANNGRRRPKKKQFKGDLKAGADSGLELSDYDVVSLHIPYGPGWNAKRIDKLVYQTDLGMNSPFNPKNKGRTLHRHAAFFGTMPECLADCCEHCPVPKNDEDRELQAEDDKSYIRGRVEFIVEDPGRQSLSGSFNPIDDGEWSEQAYIGVTEKFFNAIAAHNRDTVAAAIKDGIDVNRRDHVGRTPLQVAVLSEATEIACDLIDADARMTARIADGRTALHLAAQLNLPIVVKKMLERSARNDEEAKAAAEKETEKEEADGKAKAVKDNEDKMATDDVDADDTDEQDDGSSRDNSEDDKSSDEDDAKGKDEPDQNADGEIIPDETEGEPDVFEIDALDWDYSLSALGYAVVFGSIEVVELLLANGANPKLITTPKHSGRDRFFHPLLLTAITENDDKANQIAEKLISAGAVVSEADDNLLTIFHRSIYSGRPMLVSTFLKVDPKAKVVLNVPWMDDYRSVVFPIVSAVNSGSYSMLAVLLAHGANLQITRDEFQRARDMRMKGGHNDAPEKFLSSTFMPIEVALTNFDDVVSLLAALGADLNLPTRQSLRHSYGDVKKYTPLDYAHTILDKIKEAKSEARSAKSSASDTTPASGTGAPLRGAESAASTGEEPAWKSKCSEMLDQYDSSEKEAKYTSTDDDGDERADYIEAYFDEMVKILTSYEAKPADEIWKRVAKSDEARRKALRKCIKMNVSVSSRRDYHHTPRTIKGPFVFYRHDLGDRAELNAHYEELYIACWNGDNARIRKLCLPQPGHKRQHRPLQISVHWGDDRKGFTPLFVALHRRHWETAKLIVAIAAAQYKPKEAKKKYRYSTVNFERPDDSDDELTYEGDDIHMDVEDTEDTEIDLIDVAKIPNDVHCNTPPTHMLESSRYPYARKNGRISFLTPLEVAVEDDDFEAFVQILDLYNVLPGQPEPDSPIGSLVKHDRPIMLDEYIRRTGQGVTLGNDSDTQDESSQNSEAGPDSNLKSYLGLNIHGKKRKDLASQRTTHITRRDELPPLWRAAKCGAIGIVRYLASDQPVAAYKYYASTHSGRRARGIRQVLDSEVVLLENLLGWATTTLNESVTTAAIVGGQSQMLETLCALRGEELEATLHLKHRTEGFNSILAAVHYTSDTNMFDFLLSKGVSPLETDHKGRNILHILGDSASSASFKLLKHALKHLPKQICERLFRQQTKAGKRTPLHLVADSARLAIVRLFIESGASQFLVRDSKGYTPLQLAVNRQQPRIAKLIAEAGPPEALTLEDSVGNTPFEMAARQAFLARLDVACSKFICPSDLEIRYNAKPFRFAAIEAELPRFRTTIDALLQEGLLINGTKLTQELLAFADRLETKVVKENIKAEEKKRLKESRVKSSSSENFDDDEREYDGTASKVLKVLADALAARPTHRQLVHLSDVLESVSRDLERFGKKEKNDAYKREKDEDEELPDEVDEPELLSALVYSW